MQQVPDSNAGYTLIKKKWEDLKKLDFPESPMHPFLMNLYLELAEYDVYVCEIAASVLEKGNTISGKSVRVDEDWNNRLDSFNAGDEAANEACSILKQYKQALDDLLVCIMSSPE